MMNVMRKILIFFVGILPLTFAPSMTVYSYSFDIDNFLDYETPFVMKKILVFISSLIKDKNEDIISRPDQKYEIEGWCTISPQDNFDMVFDYGSDSIGAAVTFELYDNKDEVGVMNIYDTGMKDYDSQSIFIKPVSDDMPGVYRLITPNGWKISENVTTGEIVLEEDTGAGNQMWRVEPDDNGLFFFYNKTSGNLLDFSDKDKPTASPEQEPFGQQFALFYRNYTGWNWYYDTDFGKYYLNGVEQENILSPFYQEGVPGEIFTGVMEIGDKMVYVHLGEPDDTFTGLVYSYDKWWYVDGGEVDYDFEGLTEYNNVFWYINDGTIDKAFQGSYEYDGASWYVSDGKAVLNRNNIQKN